MKNRLALAVALLLTSCGSDPPPAAEVPASPPTSEAAPIATTSAKGPRHYELEGGALKLPSPIDFQPGTAVLAPSSGEALAYVKDYLTDKPDITMLRIEGHVDSSTPDAQALSEKRALAVARSLASSGAPCARLVAVGFGGNKPVAEKSTPEGKAQNTHISFYNAALRGRAIGGLPLDGGGKSAGDACK